jgi:hypothetical protein
MRNIKYKDIHPKLSVREELERCNAIVVLRRLEDYFKSHHGYDRGLRGLSAEDFSMMVIEKILSGQRSWYKSEETNFINFCTSVMCSELSNFRSSVDYTKVRSYDFNLEKESRWTRVGLYDEFNGF